MEIEIKKAACSIGQNSAEDEQVVRFLRTRDVVYGMLGARLHSNCFTRGFIIA